MTFAPHQNKSWNVRGNFMNCSSLYFILLEDRNAKRKSMMTFTRPLESLTQHDLFLAYTDMMETQF